MHYTCSWGSHKESWQSPVFRNMILHLWLIFIASPDLERELDALWSLPTQWLFLLLVTAPQYPSVWPVWRLLFKASAPQFVAMPHCWSSQAWEGCWKQLTCHLEAPETCCLNLIHKNPQREQRELTSWLGRIPWGCTAGCCVGLSFTEQTVLATHPKRAPILDKEQLGWNQKGF